MVNTSTLKQVEIDFIEFMSELTGLSYEVINKKYQSISEEFRCYTSEFKIFMDKVYRVNKILYDYEELSQQISSYQKHDLMLLLRYLSYSHIADKVVMPKKKRPLDYFFGSAEEAPSFLSKSDLDDSDVNVFNWHKGLAFQHSKIASYLCSRVQNLPVVVDYGSGLGYVSFEIGKLIPGAIIYLVDIDSLVLKFTEYRFKKHNLNVHTIPIKENNGLYPELPEHNICIATEVMEHVKDPLRILANIETSIMPSGILFGNFHDHGYEEQHISTDLSDVRESLNSSFVKITEMVWRKV